MSNVWFVFQSSRRGSSLRDKSFNAIEISVCPHGGKNMYFVPTMESRKFKLLPSPMEKTIQNQKELVLEMQLERAEFEIFKLKGQVLIDASLVAIFSTLCDPIG